MPVRDISTVSKMLFGICCLEEKESDRIHTLWSQRFTEHAAFLVDSQPGESVRMIVEKLEQKLRGQLIRNMNGQSIILALFLDLTKELEPKWLKTLWSLQTIMDNYFGTSTQLVLQFGFVGKLNLESATKQRENASVIVNELNGTKPAAVRYTLCMVAKPALADDTSTNWKAVMLFLDILRRQMNPSEILPVTDDGNQNNDIAYLRYEEYDEKEYKRLTTRRQILEQRLNNHGQQEFAQVIERYHQSIREQIEQRFLINGGAQPQHTGMVLDGARSGLLSNPVSQAKRGRNPIYNQGKDVTYSAIQATARRLEGDIDEFFSSIIKAAPEKLQMMIEQVNLGIALKKNRDEMHTLLNTVNTDRVTIPELLLNYSEGGAAQEIGAFLKAIRRKRTKENWEKYRQALVKAYDSFSDFDNEEAELRRESDDINRRLANIQQPREFCNQIVAFREPSICDFNIANGNGKIAKFILARKSELIRMLDEATVAGTAVRCFKIKETGSGIAQLDNAPLKALQAVYLDYSEQVMRDLLPDVEV